VPRFFALEVPVEDFFSRLDSTSLGGILVPSLSIEDLLFVLCVHGTHHLWARLVWISDLAQILHRHATPGATRHATPHAALDWEQLLEDAAARGATRLVLLGLSLARDLLQAPLPEHLRRRAEDDPVIGFLARTVRAQLGGAAPMPPGLWRQLAFRIGVRERWRDRARFLSRVLTPSPKDWALVPLPRPFRFAYTLLRPPRLLWTHRRGLRR
jgi:hypothetical protein